MNFLETYKGKKVFVTGHTGFKGSWLISWLSELGAQIKGYALAPENDHDLFHQINGHKLCDSVIGDIMDFEKLEQSMLDFEPDFIFHLAAQPLVRLSYQIPVQTFAVNSIGTAHLMEALRRLQKPCQVVIITTDKVYHNNEWVYPYRENDRLGGYDPYSASKACAELVLDSFRNSFFNLKDYAIHQKGIAVARAGNVIGGGDWAKDRIIPDTVKSLQQHQPVTIRNPRSVRPWQHVLEPLSGYLQLGAHLAKTPLTTSTAFNFGPYIEDNLDVESLVKTAIDVWGQGTYEITAQTHQPHEAGLLKLDISKAINELNWRPKLNARQAITYTINWYRQATANNALTLVKQDIAAYASA